MKIPQYIIATETDKEKAEKYLKGKHFPEPITFNGVEESYSSRYGWEYTLHFVKNGVHLKETLSQYAFKTL